MSSSSLSAKATKKSAFSCETCRKRKVKCGGEQPRCNRCTTRQDDCVYKLNPTLSYTQRLEQRVEELEQQLSRVQGSAHLAGCPTALTNSSPFTLPRSVARSPQNFSDDSLPGGFKGLKTDDKGTITYHGATSFFQLLGANTSSVLSSNEGTFGQAIPSSGSRERLVTNAWQQRILESQSEIPEPFRYLLDTHWCWIQPLFNFIYRPAFTRDMQTIGPYYSHTLLNAVLSHSIRWGKSDQAIRQQLDTNYDGGTIFGRHARTMLFDELSCGVCSIPTVQTLLILSAQECSLGNSAQAYVYSGIAFRLVDHMGICVDGLRYAGSARLSEEDVEIRRRLFWSCYFWDKMISLYLGRSPSIQHSTVSPPQIMLDDSAETEPWTPFGLEADVIDYPPTAAHSTSCFMKMCELSVIFNQILIHMYDPLSQNSETEMQECLAVQEAALQRWWDELPNFLKLDPSDLPSRAPPSHIVTLNCLYHTFKILLYRPMLSRTSSQSPTSFQPNPHNVLECVTSATSIIAIFDLFCRSFGYSRCVLSLSYSVYIAASIFLLQVQASVDDEMAVRRLEYCIKGLQRSNTATPVISSALSLINRELTELGIELSGSGPARQRSPALPLSNFPMSNYTIEADTSSHVPPIIHHPEKLFYFNDLENAGHGAPTVSSHLFEAVSLLEPISARVGALEGQDWYPS